MATDADNPYCIDAISNEAAVTAIQQALEQGLLQIGRPLSISIGGRSVSYGSASEAFLAIKYMQEIIKEQRNLCGPWVQSSVARSRR
jgi:hypothetical protein